MRFSLAPRTIPRALLPSILLCAFTLWLAGCSDSEPDGYVFQMNGAGMTLPAAGAEVAFLPGNSRAEFFYRPLKEAYAYATKDLRAELVPICSEAETVLSTLKQENSSGIQDLRNTGNLPETADACFNMCTQRVSLEEQRAQARQQLTATISRLDTEIAGAQKAIAALRASRSEKAGELGRRLSNLEATRQDDLSQRAQKLLDEQLARIKFSIGGELKTAILYEGKQVKVTLINDSDYAIVPAQFSNRAVLEGYHKGVKIVESEIMLPRYGEPEELRDQFGFSKGYSVPAGGQTVIGVSIGDFPGLDVASPSGRLLAAERGWSANAEGYILPDEVRIKSFAPDLFVIPDDAGTRSGSSITYHPKKVDFRAEAAAEGLPQDAEIASLKRQIGNQSYPEDEQLREQNALIASLNDQKNQATEDFNGSALASQISQLTRSESSCRSARDSLDALENEGNRLAEIAANLASCGSETLDPTAVYSAVGDLNRFYDASIEMPDISSLYRRKAKALIMSKVAENIETTSLSRIDGGYSLPGGVDPNSSMALVSWRSGFGESFWFQPLDSLGERKDLTYITAEDGSFEEYVDQVISFGLGIVSIDDLSSRLMQVGLEAISPYVTQAHFHDLAESAAEDLESLAAQSSMEISDEPDAPTEKPLSCEP